MRALKIFQERAIKAEHDAGAEMFMGLPDNWYEPRPQYGCENGHVSGIYIKSELRGHLCPACQTAIAMIPHGYTDETLAAALDSIRAESTPASQPSPAPRCSCPSGDGSLRWPCPVCQPEKPSPSCIDLIRTMRKAASEQPFPACSDKDAEPIYFVRYACQDGWKEATEEAYWLFSEGNRRVLYATPAGEAQECEMSDGEIYAAVSRRANPEGHAQTDREIAEVCAKIREERAPSGESIATWQERAEQLGFSGRPQGYPDTEEQEQLKAAEIADLRAALARRATAGTTAAPSSESVKPWEDRESLYETDVFSKIERMEAEIADWRATAGNAAPTELSKRLRNLLALGEFGPDHSGTISAAADELDHLASNAGAAPAEPKKELAHGHRDDFYLMANGRRIAQHPISMIRTMPNWALASELFATGSNSARRICQDAGIDPDAYTIGRAPSNPPVGTKEQK